MKITFLSVCLLTLLFTLSTQTFAVDFTVNQAGDAGDLTCDATCTLRDAVDDTNAAATNDTISFAAGLTTITLTDQILINNGGTLTITGPGANVLTIDGGAGRNRIFQTGSATVTIRGVTLSGGNNKGAAVLANSGTLILEEVVVQNNAGDGSVGAVAFNGGTNHRIANSTISGNTLFNDCAAIYALNTSLTVVNTTVSGNSTDASGFGTGAICIDGISMATFRNTTISGNTAGGTGFLGGGGIFNANSTVDLGNTIVAGNTAANPGPDLYRFSSRSTFTTSGGNLIGDNSGNPSEPNTVTFPTGNPNANGDKVGTGGSVINPLLGPLQNNGGPTPTRALLVGSPAVDAGLNALAVDPFNGTALAFDQRGTGFPRIRDGNGDGTAIVDIGAVELQACDLIDTDSDGIGNACDSDDDNDGVIDGQDAFPLDPNESVDTDSDGTGNNADTDDDNDGVSDADEISAGSDPLNGNSKPEVCDGVDNDLNDGVDEGFVNSDGDTMANCVDPDDDNDGVLDGSDAFPLDPNESVDTDGDGIGNNADLDDDNDGQSDINEIACGSNPLDAASKCTPSTTGPPTNIEQCKNGGWKTFTVPRRFKNQGDCIQFVNTGK